MGQKYAFRCSGCGYAAEVSGGENWGMLCRTHTIYCKDCRALYDIVTAESPRDAKPIRELSSEQYRCPKSRLHAIKLWRHPGPCPRCGQTLERADTPTLEWD